MIYFRPEDYDVGYSTTHADYPAYEVPRGARSRAHSVAGLEIVIDEDVDALNIESETKQAYATPPLDARSPKRRSRSAGEYILDEDYFEQRTPQASESHAAYPAYNVARPEVCRKLGIYYLHFSINK